MNGFVQIIIVIVQALGEAAGPLLERVLAKAVEGKDPLDALEEEDLAAILGTESALRVAEQIARARANAAGTP